ncbi:uncharacterized protein G2W53_015003 [Senna tora]|uniref:Uncharacterized protein n=1 Tax=Senna tora TaxID=362788 RepID=A0A834WUC4_9FABA|nr:uncharacterized protein G2W53_015003 [Senna tora]
MLQRDDGTERSVATRRGHREICPVAMDPPSMVIVFAADEGRTFIADSQHSTVQFQSQSSVIATINSSNISPIYRTLPFLRWRRLLLLHSPEPLLRFLRQDLLQRDDGAERSNATR